MFACVGSAMPGASGLLYRAALHTRYKKLPSDFDIRLHKGPEERGGARFDLLTPHWAGPLVAPSSEHRVRMSENLPDLFPIWSVFCAGFCDIGRDQSKADAVATTAPGGVFEGCAYRTSGTVGPWPRSSLDPGSAAGVVVAGRRGAP